MLRYTKDRAGLVALYDIRPGNGAGQFLQPRSPHRAFRDSGPSSNDDYLGHSKNHDWLIDWLRRQAVADMDNCNGEQRVRLSICPSIHIIMHKPAKSKHLGRRMSIKHRQENLQSVQKRSWCASHVHNGRLFSYQRQTMCVTVSTYINPSTDTLYWKMNMKKRRAKLSCLDWLTDRQ